MKSGPASVPPSLLIVGPHMAKLYTEAGLIKRDEHGVLRIERVPGLEMYRGIEVRILEELAEGPTAERSWRR